MNAWIKIVANLFAMFKRRPSSLKIDLKDENTYKVYIDYFTKFYFQLLIGLLDVTGKWANMEYISEASNMNAHDMTKKSF